MSATQLVSALVEEMGHATVDDLMPEMEGYTRQQVLSALSNAVQTDLLECDGPGPRRGIGGGRGSLPATYRPKRATEQRRPASSVWHFAQQIAA